MQQDLSRYNLTQVVTVHTQLGKLRLTQLQAHVNPSTAATLCFSSAHHNKLSQPRWCVVGCVAVLLHAAVAAAGAVLWEEEELLPVC